MENRNAELAASVDKNTLSTLMKLVVKDPANPDRGKTIFNDKPSNNSNINGMRKE